MDQVIGTIAASLTHQAAEAGAEIAIEPLPAITSDRLALEQIFSNLLDNAVKYLRRDAPGRITVRGRATPAYAIYEVEDNSRGIEERITQFAQSRHRSDGYRARPRRRHGSHR